MLMHARTAPVGSHDIAAFRKHGFVKFRGLLARQELDSLQAALCDAIASLGQSPNGYDVTAAADWLWDDAAAVSTGNSVQHDLSALAQAVRNSNAPRLVDRQANGARGHFLLDTSVWRRVPALADFALTSALPRVAAALLGCEPIRYYDDQLFVKQPGAVDRTAFHQDFPYFHLDRPDGCVFWIPLAKVTEGGGRMGYIPGSHRWGHAYRPNIFVSSLAFPGSEGPELPPVDDNPAAYGVNYVEAEPGDVIVHHFLTVHGAEGNRGRSNRAAFSLRYCDANVRYRQRPGAPPQPLHRADMKDGDVLDADIHPIVRLPTGQPWTAGEGTKSGVNQSTGADGVQPLAIV
jgi:ectoine hydroxylase-related dioxygenase (phytanoyl-CoA dioxygenase family)